MLLSRHFKKFNLMKKGAFLKLRSSPHTEVEKKIEHEAHILPNFIKRKEYEKENLSQEQKENLKRFDIFRFNPEDTEKEIVSYYVDLKDCGPMVLDALIKIKDEKDSTLAFRR